MLIMPRFAADIITPIGVVVNEPLNALLPPVKDILTDQLRPETMARASVPQTQQCIKRLTAAIAYRAERYYP